MRAGRASVCSDKWLGRLSKSNPNQRFLYGNSKLIYALCRAGFGILQKLVVILENRTPVSGFALKLSFRF